MDHYLSPIFLIGQETSTRIIYGTEGHFFLLPVGEIVKKNPSNSHFLVDAFQYKYMVSNDKTIAGTDTLYQKNQHWQWLPTLFLRSDRKKNYPLYPLVSGLEIPWEVLGKLAQFKQCSKACHE